MKKTANEFQSHFEDGRRQTANGKPAEEVSEKMAHLITERMAVPKSGGLTPHASIQQRVRATMQPRKSFFATLRDKLQFHIPMYQAAFGMAMACFIVFASSHILSSNNSTTPQTSDNGLGLLDSTAVLGAISREALRTTTSDSLGALRFDMPDTFSNAVVDTL